ncbi:MAG: dihydroorotase [Flavobacteriaceae bacterium TMED184]|nr:MAG: dihydroorotase [Flavobacteriaceae bacterium TMED184]
MMKKTLIKNAILINENKISQKDLLIKGEYIYKIDDYIEEINVEKIIDAKGLHLIPGWIDDQVHFREPGLVHKGNISSESKAAVAGGITSYIEMPNTIPQTITEKALDEKIDIASKNSFANYSFLFGGTNNNIDDIKNFDKKKAAGLKLFLGSSTGNMLVDDLDVLREIFLATDLPIAVHCEDEDIIRENIKLYKKTYGKEIPIEKHPMIRSEKACYLSSKKAIALARETGARLHVFHLSTAIETKLFDNNIPLEEKKITSEVCVHHLWFSEKDYQDKGNFIKWNPSIKKDTDQLALWEALNDDRIDILATDHAPHLESEKKLDYLNCPSGGPMVQHALPAMLTAYKKGKISLEKIVEKACHNPAKLFKIKKRGFLREGYFADLVLIDLEKKNKVLKDSLFYLCGWSPFEGTTFESSVVKTFINGKIVYDFGQIVSKPSGKRLEFDRN